MNLREMLIRDEGRAAHVYEDSEKYLTIGVGHLVDKRRGGALPEFIIDLLLDYDIETKSGELFRQFSWMTTLNEPRQAVVISMAFQLGIDGLAKFVKALAFLRSGEYSAAAIEFADSKVAREQSPERWRRHCQILKTGVWV